MRAFTSCVFFFFNDTATTEIYTLSLHDALPISPGQCPTRAGCCRQIPRGCPDRKSTRLNSSHGYISYAVFCLKKKKKHKSTKLYIYKHPSNNHEHTPKRSS